MRYSYFPGCSAKTGGRAYEESFLAICKALDIQLEEIEEWNCCGATSYMSIEESHAYALSTRNLVLAERMGADMVTPCGGCYGVLLKAHHYWEKYPRVRQFVDEGLKAAGMEYHGTAKVKHPIEVLLNDVGAKAIRAKVKRPLKGLKVASYYGCRLLRPISPFDDMHEPKSMETLFKAVGARVIDFPLKTKCCGGAVTGTLPEAGLDLCWLILRDAQRREADVIATNCPLCQFNLEAYQDEVIKAHPEIKPMPIAYFTQLMGVALGLDSKELALQRCIVPVEPILREKGILGEPEAKKEKQPAGTGA